MSAKETPKTPTEFSFSIESWSKPTVISAATGAKTGNDRELEFAGWTRTKKFRWRFLLGAVATWRPILSRLLLSVRRGNALTATRRFNSAPPTKIKVLS